MERITLIGDMLFQFSRQFHEKCLVTLEKEGLPAAGRKKNQRKALNCLYACGSKTASELGRQLNLEKGSMTPMIDQLEEQGLLYRRRDREDRRRLELHLTEAGKAEVEEMRRYFSEHLSERLADIPEEEIEEFFDHLQKALAFMERI